MKKTTKHATLKEHLDKTYGKKGSKERAQYEKGYEVFKIGVMLEEIRKEKGLTKEQLAKRCGTTENYISRIENGTSDISIGTLIRIIHTGLNAHLTVSIE